MRTRVGYTGGEKVDPTYHDLGEHTETLEIEYDPTLITYGELIEKFWASHNPCARRWSRQYMSAVWVHDDEQRKIATETKQAVNVRLGSEVETPILEAVHFYAAEDYHQKFYLRQKREIVKELKAYYPADADMVASTVAARLNGVFGGDAAGDVVRSEIDAYGLSDASTRDVIERVKGR